MELYRDRLRVAWNSTPKVVMTDIPVAKAQLLGRMGISQFEQRTATWMSSLKEPTWRAVRDAHTGHSIHVVSDRPFASPALTSDLEFGLRLLAWMSPRPIVWYWWDQPWDRRLPANTDPRQEHLNGGWAVPNVLEVHVYRREEAHKVLLHEAIHAIGLDVPQELTDPVRVRFEAALGGARRDEERSRAKERIFSFRNDSGGWDPKNQRPELWNLYNGRIKQGEQVRVFPISNWTELDIWQYIAEEQLEIPSIYFAHERELFERDGMLYATSEVSELIPGETTFTDSVRYRTVGDMSCTGAVRSSASTLEQVVKEIAATRITERGETRADDRASEAAMEDRKKEGYF